MEFIPYKANEYLDDLYYQVPVELFINPIYKNALNSDSKLLYAFLRNRHQLSVRNNWIDENGYIYLIFTRKELQEKLNLLDKTVTKTFKQLVSVKLIYEKKQGNNKPNIIYIGKYGRIRLKFLKEHKKGFYTELMIEGLLSYHLAEIDKDATKVVRNISINSFEYV